MLSNSAAIENTAAELESLEGTGFSTCQVNRDEFSNHLSSFDERIFEHISNLYRSIASKCLDLRGSEDFRKLTNELAGERLQAEVISNTSSSIVGTQNPIEAQTSLDDIRRVARERQSTIVKYAFETKDSIGRIDRKPASKIFIWVITPSGDIDFTEIDIPKNVSIEDLILEGRNELGIETYLESSRGGLENSNTPNEDTLEALYTYLIEDIEALLPSDSTQKVIFVADGQLAAVPFAALKDDEGTYLIEKHTILFAPSINTLDLISDRKGADRSRTKFSATVIGDPSTFPLDGKALPPLPYAAREAQQISQLLETTPILGKDATQANLVDQMQTSSIIHFAAHGLLNDTDDFGMLGTIALAADDYSNGFLTASEIIDLRLTADLVVLSACDTGLGVVTEDSILGLSSAFIAAGASSVVSTLWSVPDASTADLMAEFYRQLDKGQSSSYALREAMLATKETYPEPRNWAAFQVIGEDYQLIR